MAEDTSLTGRPRRMTPAESRARQSRGGPDGSNEVSPATTAALLALFSARPPIAPQQARRAAASLVSPVSRCLRTPSAGSGTEPAPRRMIPMSTETTTPAGRAKQIRERLAEIAPYPRSSKEVTAASLARPLAVRALVIHQQILHPDGELTPHQVDTVTLLFGLAHALFALHGEEGGSGVAEQIWAAWEDGSGVGEWLWDHLGDEKAREVAALAEELLALKPPAGGLLAHSGALRQALGFAIVNAATDECQRPYRDALAALEGEIEKAGDAS